MVKNNHKHLKISKKIPFSSCAQEAHKRLTKKNEEKSLLGSVEIHNKYDSFSMTAYPFPISLPFRFTIPFSQVSFPVSTFVAIP